MDIQARPGCSLLVILLCAAAASAQQTNPQTQPPSGRIYLDVVVSPKSGPPVTGLQKEEFTVLDNKKPQTITSFQAVSGREAPIEIILVIDAANANYPTLGFGRTQVDKFLRAEGGHLAYPIALAVLKDEGIQILADFSTDGNVLSAALDQTGIGVRVLGRSAGFYGAAERLRLSLKALSQLAGSKTPLQRRKVILWLSPGWPLMSGPSVLLDTKQQEGIFSNIVTLSTQLRQGRVTLYSIDPLGTGESLSRASYYKAFLKGVSKPSQAQFGNLGLPVLAVQSGGLALEFDNDVARLLRECLSDSAPYYEISFDPPPTDRRDEYHEIEIKLAKPGLTARTRQGYYAQPSPHN